MKIQQVFGAALFAAIMSSHQLLAKDISDISDPVPVTIRDSEVHVEYRIVGVTSYEDDGAFEFQGLLGVAAMNKACKVEFGAGARAATISDALTMDESLGTDVPAWLAPGSPIAHYVSPDATHLLDFYYDSLSGVPVSSATTDKSPEKVYCHRYTYGGLEEGITIRYSGIVPDACIKIFPVACSAPVAIPVRE